ncbi:MAG TPA: MgtC/SapB family protein [Candidatus Binatia bacterium]|nr:MgtC/SapB family protein [Candidatus Binatia bacterium]
MDWLDQIEIIGEVALAILLGGVIGFEREAADKPAGFRTHMLVAGAAALLVGLSSALIESFGADSAPRFIRSDPIRLVQGIIIGISFIGGGTIIRHARTQHVEGLTTAASLLLTGGIGIAVALRQFVIAVGTTLLAIVVLRVLVLLENYLKRRTQQRQS